MQGNVLSNVIGAPFEQYVIDQLRLRTSRGSTQNRSTEEILYLANKMSWTRLTSSVRIKPADGQPISKFYANLFDGQVPPGNYSEADSLAKNWILQAGTNQYDNGTYNLRYGLGPDNAYGLGGIDQQGYRPMPGLTSITIDTKGTLGSLREATINFSVWNMTQLNVIEALYFRLGYTMLLEWGHVNYFTNPTLSQPNGEFVTNSYGIDFFKYKSKEAILQAITQRNQQTNGNYEAMLGTVTNFFFSFNSQGGYDCSIKLIGLGSIIDTIKINQTFIMPEGLVALIEEAQATIDKNKADEDRKRDEAARVEQGKPAVPLGPVTNLEDIKAVVKSATGRLLVVDSISHSSTQFVSSAGVSSVDYYYKAQGGLSTAYNNELNGTSDSLEDLGKDRTGLFLNINKRRTKWQRIPANVSPSYPQPVKLDVTLLKSISNNNRQRYSSSALVQGGTIQYKAGLSDITLTVNNFVNPNNSITSDYLLGLFDRSLISSTIGSDSKITLLPTTPIPKIKAGGPKTFGVVFPYITTVTGKAEDYEQKFYAFIVTVNQGADYITDTRENYITALSFWLLNGGVVNIDNIEAIKILNQRDVLIHGLAQGISTGNTPLKVEFITNDSGLISQVLPRPPKDGSPIPQPGTTVDSQGDTVGQENEISPAQDKQKEQFVSSLHTMLTTVGVIGRSKATGNTNAVIPIDLTEITKIFYNSGILQNVITSNTGLNQSQQSEVRQGNFDSPLLGGVVDFDLTQYAIRGFNSNLMADKTNYYKTNPINWTNFGKENHICTAYYVAYEFADNETMTSSTAEKPVYIKLGYLLAFLNNMCLLYESTSEKNSGKGPNSNTVKPYIYIDFHPEYNLCLTSPLHMTIDPYKCLIPFAADNEDFISLFKDVNAKEVLKDDIYKPQDQNTLSTGLKAFKTDKAYRGKTMEILLNTQFILDLANRYITSDQQSALNLKPFLDSVMDEINRSTGNFNMFRVAYRDDSNTIIIKDDQWVPNLPGETSAIVREDYKADRKYMELQVFGSGSLVREMEFRTNMNTKMSAMIAISAQSGTQVANGSNASPIGTYNLNYEDSIMAIKQDASSGSIGTRSKIQLDEEQKAKQLVVDTNNDAAIKFNSYVKAVYYDGRVPTSQTSFATKYYQDRLTNKKGTDPVTQASEFIPANLSITLDGISGIVMANAFAIPENRLPATLRGTDGFSKVGFVVVGLTHTLEGNQWLTKIRGQMIKLREAVGSGTTKIGSDSNTFKYPVTVVSDGTVSDTIKGNALYNDTAFRAKLKQIADKYQLSDVDILKVMSKESGLNPKKGLYRRDAKPIKYSNSPQSGYTLVAAGLIQFTKPTLSIIGVSNLEQVINANALTQLDYVDNYFKANKSRIQGADIYRLYAVVFLPAIVPALTSGRDSDPLKAQGLSATLISESNPIIATTVGKVPGTPLTIGDFKRYVNTII